MASERLPRPQVPANPTAGISLALLRVAHARPPAGAPGIEKLPPNATSLGAFTARVLIVAGAVAAVYLIWQMRTALLLAFAGVLFAVLFSGLAARVSTLTRVPHGWSLAAVLALGFAAFGGGGYMLGQRVAGQFGEIAERAREAAERLPFDLSDVLDRADALIAPATKWAAGTAQGFAYAALVLAVGVYLAASPARNRRGLLLLVPPGRMRDRVEATFLETGKSLWEWLMGTFVSMIIVGILSTVGLLLLGVPAALTLGLIAGLLEFVPILGPWAAAVPAVLVAMASGGWSMALYVAGLYAIIQMIEGNVIYPLVQRRAVALPPAMTLIALVAFTLVFGLFGALIATPLLVAMLVFLNKLYLEPVLGERERFLDH